MRIIETKVYTINEHPMKSLCFDWMRENLHDLNQYSAQEVTDSIEALSEAIGGTNDYLSRASFYGMFVDADKQIHTLPSIAKNNFGSSPQSGGVVKFKNYSVKALIELDPEALELTGTWSDFGVIKSLQDSPSFKDEEGNLICYPVGILDELHSDTEYRYSDEGLEEYADINEFEFTTKGELI